MRTGKWLLLSLSFFVVIQNAFACQYNVRDVGFSDIGSSPYRLHYYTQPDTSPERVAIFRQVAATVLRQTNVGYQVLEVGVGASAAAGRYVDFWDIETFPSAVLISPEGTSLVMPIPTSIEAPDDQTWQAIEACVTSPMRERISRHLVRAYAVVLLVHGTDVERNERVRLVAQDAIRQIERVMPQMPKRIEEPPCLVELVPTRFPEERVLLWSLGLDAQADEAPAIAVLYGRGRLMGEVLEASEIRSQRLLHMLSIVGASCECDLDRRWILGRMLPFRWGAKQRADAVESLGFDTDSPMVRAEMAHILSIPAPNDGTNGLLEDLWGGYSEQALEVESSSKGSVMNPAQLRNLKEPAAPSEGTTENSPLSSMLYVLPIAVLLTLVVGGGILIQARRRKA